MKAIPFALACALLGATALVPAAYAQSSGSSPGSTEASPSTSASDITGRGDRDRDWRGNRDDGDRMSARDSANRSYAEEEDDYDDHLGPGTRRAGANMAGKDPDMMRQHMRMMREHHRMGAGMGMGQRGARLQLKRGDSSIDIRCPARENITACVDAVGKLMDRLQSMPGSTGSTTTTTPRP